MRSEFSRKLETGLAIVLGVVGLYCLMGVLQAAFLFTGTRALSNANNWGSLALALCTLSLALLLRPDRLLSRLPPYGAWLVAVCLATVCASSAWELFDVLAVVDACLDQGGSYNYVASSCEHSGVYPVMSLFQWQGLRLTWILLLMFASGAAVLVAVFGKRSGPNSL